MVQGCVKWSTLVGDLSLHYVVFRVIEWNPLTTCLSPSHPVPLSVNECGTFPHFGLPDCSSYLSDNYSQHSRDVVPLLASLTVRAFFLLLN